MNRTRHTRQKSHRHRNEGDQLSHDEELAIIERQVAALKKDPEALFALARKAGILTAKGNLTKAFGG